MVYMHEHVNKAWHVHRVISAQAALHYISPHLPKTTESLPGEPARRAHAPTVGSKACAICKP